MSKRENKKTVQFFLGISSLLCVLSSCSQKTQSSHNQEPTTVTAPALHAQELTRTLEDSAKSAALIHSLHLDYGVHGDKSLAPQQILSLSADITTKPVLSMQGSLQMLQGTTIVATDIRSHGDSVELKPKQSPDDSWFPLPVSISYIDPHKSLIPLLQSIKDPQYVATEILSFGGEPAVRTRHIAGVIPKEFSRKKLNIDTLKDYKTQMWISEGTTPQLRRIDIYLTPSTYLEITVSHLAAS